MRKICTGIIILFSFNFLVGHTQQRKDLKQKKESTKEYEVAVYYFPDYHPDSINAKWHGKGWTEWGFRYNKRYLPVRISHLPPGVSLRRNGRENNPVCVEGSSFLFYQLNHYLYSH